MALSASTIINAAKQRAFGIIGPQKISDAALLGELSYQDQLITQMFSQIAPDLLATVSGTISLSDAGNTNGYTLESGIHYRDFAHYDGDETYVPIEIYQRQYRDSEKASPSGTLRLSGGAAVFYPFDPLNKRWGGTDARQYFEPDEGHVVYYSYVPIASPVTSLSATLRSPDMAREVIVQSLVLSIILSRPEVSQVNLELEMAKRQGMMDSLRMQAYKFSHPAGHRPEGARWIGESAWVQENI